MACARRSSSATGLDLAAHEAGRVERIYRPRSFTLSVVDWFHVAGLYVPYVAGSALAFAIWCLLPQIELPQPTAVVEAVSEAGVSGVLRGAGQWLHASALQAVAQVLSATDHVRGVWWAYAIAAFCLYYLLSAKPPVYLVDFAVYEPPKEWRVSRGDLVEIMRRHGCFTEESLAFMAKLLANSGTGEATHWPPGTTRLIRHYGEPHPVTGEPMTTADRSMAAARFVAEATLCDCFEQVLKRTGYKAKDVDFLVVNCSLFCPTPSLASIIANKFGLRNDCRSYNLGGMGCSAGLISIDLAKQLLQNRRNSVAVVLSTEEISQQLYLGNERSLLLQNTLFRVGGSGALLSNKPMDGFRAKYKLLHTVRVQDNSEAAHKVVYQCEDAVGLRGIHLGKEITKVAGRALQTNLTKLGPVVLPIREQVKAIASVAHRWAVKRLNAMADKNGWAALPFSDTTPLSAEELGAVETPGSPVAPMRSGSSGGSGPAPSPIATVSQPASITAAAASAPGANKRPAAPRRPGRYALPDAYVPDFKRALQHFCIHAGGRAVIDGIEQNLNLERWHTAPSRATLYHWGNTSSSSIWYELRYCEGENDVVVPEKQAAGAAAAASESGSSATASSSSASSGNGILPAPRKRSGSEAALATSKPSASSSEAAAVKAPAPSAAAPNPDAEAAANGWDPERKWALPEYRGRTIRRGERVLQIAFGSGFKCNSAVWLRLR